MPYYGAILEFFNFALLLLTFVLCLSREFCDAFSFVISYVRQRAADHDKTKMTLWEMMFILFAGAITLEEYTAATEHGWISKYCNLFLRLNHQHYT